MKSYYERFLSEGSVIEIKDDINKDHGFVWTFKRYWFIRAIYLFKPSPDGGPCESLNSPYFINNCDGYNGAFHILNKVSTYQPHNPPTQTRFHSVDNWQHCGQRISRGQRVWVEGLWPEWVLLQLSQLSWNGQWGIYLHPRELSEWIFEVSSSCPFTWLQPG